MAGIQASVGMRNGVQCYNLVQDQLEVVRLLKGVPASEGGVSAAIDLNNQIRPGVCPKALYDYILNFQNIQKSKGRVRFADGHVDPNDDTMRMLILLQVAHGSGSMPGYSGQSTVSERDVVTETLIDLCVKDSRLAGVPPRVWGEYLEPTFYTPHASILRWILSKTAGQATPTRIHRLNIAAHGLGSWFDSDHPGYGVLLGGEALHLGVNCTEDHEDLDSNVTLLHKGYNPPNLAPWFALHGFVDQIILWSCGAAAVAPMAQGDFGNGRRLCSDLARITGAVVIASDAVQVFSTDAHHRYKVGKWVYVDQGNPTIRYGFWEGTVYAFTPTGQVTSRNGDIPEPYDPGVDYSGGATPENSPGRVFR